MKTTLKVPEVWTDLPTYGGFYQVSTLARVKSLDRVATGPNREPVKVRGRILTPQLSNRGNYKTQKLQKKGISKSYKISVLVAMTYLGHKPDGTNTIVVDHIDNDSTNDLPSNLQLLSNRANCSKDIDKSQTSSRYIGVHYSKTRNKFIATIRIAGRKKNLGGFPTELEAHQCYQSALQTLKP